MASGVGDPESEPFCRVQFSYQKTRHGTISIHEADCGTEISILNLKEDLSKLFSVDETHQEWFFRDIKMENNKTLSFYRRKEGGNARVMKIFVKGV